MDHVYYTSYLKGKKVSIREMAELFDYTKSSIEYLIKKLIKAGYLQKNKFNRNITATELTKLTFLKQTK